MKPPRIPIKGPIGKDEEGNSNQMPEVQEGMEMQGDAVDVVNGNFTQDPFSLKAPETDHTPNFTKGPKQSKPHYGEYHDGAGNRGIGL